MGRLTIAKNPGAFPVVITMNLWVDDKQFIT
jgi:hypothetical protein